MKLNQKVALITGSARGIGRSISIKMATEGALVILTDINEERLKETYDKDIKGINSNCTFMKLDVTKENQIEEITNKIVTQFGRIDILVNNAGLLSNSLIVNLDEEEWDRIINVNLKGTFLVTKAILKIMIKQRNGRIVNIASNCGITGQKYLSHYCSSKFGIIGFTQSAALEVAEYNVLINAVCPGPTNTELHHNDLEKQGKLRGILKDEVLKEEINTIPLKKLAKPEEIAQVVLFLSSDENTHISGESINISGGLEFH